MPSPAALAGAGADVILNGRDTVALGEAADKLAQSGVRVRGVAFDVTSEDSVNDAIEHIESEIGPIDILVNNAGMQHRAPLARISGRQVRPDHADQRGLGLHSSARRSPTT